MLSISFREVTGNLSICCALESVKEVVKFTGSIYVNRFNIQHKPPSRKLYETYVSKSVKRNRKNKHLKKIFSHDEIDKQTDEGLKLSYSNFEKCKNPIHFRFSIEAK